MTDWKQRAEALYVMYSKLTEFVGLPGVRWADVDFFLTTKPYQNMDAPGFIAANEAFYAEVDAESEREHPGRSDQIMAALREGNLNDPAIQAAMADLFNQLGD